MGGRDLASASSRVHARRGSLIQSSSAERFRGTLAQQIAVRILTGELPEGHVFPSEVEFAEALGISRSALREALRTLAAKGLVESRPKAGTRVTPKWQWSLLDPDLLAWQFEAEPSAKFLRDLFELRMILEPTAAALAAERRTEAQVASMRGELEVMADLGLGTAEGRLADQRFHMIMLEATGNDAIISLASSIMAAIAWTTIYKQRNGALPRDPIPDHRALLDAIAVSDVAASRTAMAELVRLALADTAIGS